MDFQSIASINILQTSMVRSVMRRPHSLIPISGLAAFCYGDEASTINNLWEIKVYFAYRLQFTIKGSHGRSLSINVEAETETRITEESCLLACHPGLLKPTFLGREPLIVDWALLHQLGTKKMPHRDAVANLMEMVPQLTLLLPRCVKLTIEGNCDRNECQCSDRILPIFGPVPKPMEWCCTIILIS